MASDTQTIREPRTTDRPIPRAILDMKGSTTDLKVKVAGEEKTIALPDHVIAAGGSIHLPEEHIQAIKDSYERNASSGIGNKLAAVVSLAVLAGGLSLGGVFFPVAAYAVSTAIAGFNKGSRDAEQKWRNGNSRLSNYFNKVQSEMLAARQQDCVDRADATIAKDGQLDEATLEQLLACPEKMIEAASVPLQITVLQARAVLDLVKQAEKNQDVTVLDKITFADWKLDPKNETHQQILLEKLKAKTEKLGLPDFEETFKKIDYDRNYGGAGFLKGAFKFALLGPLFSNFDAVFKQPKELSDISDVVSMPDLPSVKGAISKINTYEQRAGKRMDLPGLVGPAPAAG